MFRLLRRMPVFQLLAIGSAAASFLWLYAALIVFLMLNPGALD